MFPPTKVKVVIQCSFKKIEWRLLICVQSCCQYMLIYHFKWSEQNTNNCLLEKSFKMWWIGHNIFANSWHSSCLKVRRPCSNLHEKETRVEIFADYEKLKVRHRNLFRHGWFMKVLEGAQWVFLQSDVFGVHNLATKSAAAISPRKQSPSSMAVMLTYRPWTPGLGPG